MALLAAYMCYEKRRLSLPDYLDEVVFAGNTGTEIAPSADEVKGFETYIKHYQACLPVELTAIGQGCEVRAYSEG